MYETLTIWHGGRYKGQEKVLHQTRQPRKYITGDSLYILVIVWSVPRFRFGHAAGRGESDRHERTCTVCFTDCNASVVYLRHPCISCYFDIVQIHISFAIVTSTCICLRLSGVYLSSTLARTSARAPAPVLIQGSVPDDILPSLLLLPLREYRPTMTSL